MRRRIWQIASTVLHNAYIPALYPFGLYQGFLKGYCTPTLNCYACPSAFTSCPIGTLQHFAMRRQFPFFLAGFLGLVGMGAGRMTCGWLCPFGLLQDGMKKVSKRTLRLPQWTGHLKYVSLVVLAVALPLALSESWFSKLCPQGAVQGAIPWTLASGSASPDLEGLDVRSLVGSFFWLKIAILGVFLTAFVFIKRPFCRTSCPLGAILSLFNRVSLVRLRINKEACVKCGFCDSVCPVDLDVMERLDSPDCIKCLDCTRCPRDAITVAFGLGAQPRASSR